MASRLRSSGGGPKTSWPYSNARDPALSRTASWGSNGIERWLRTGAFRWGNALGGMELSCLTPASRQDLHGDEKRARQNPES
jgi:hypothetical protein